MSLPVSRNIQDSCLESRLLGKPTAKSGQGTIILSEDTEGKWEGPGGPYGWCR